MGRRIAVVGAGWAGLAAAVECTAAGDHVTLFEMAPLAGGRARDVLANDATPVLDNGQHICIGAYSATLDLLQHVGVAEADAFLRLPLRLVDADGVGLRLPAGHPVPAFVRAVVGHRGWTWPDRLSLLRTATAWAVHGFRCDEAATVNELVRPLTLRVRADLIEPLCVAALNTPAAEASGLVFLRVLRDALFSGAGASDLLLPRVGLGSLLPGPCLAWLHDRGASTRLGRRVERITVAGVACRVDDSAFDAVVVACSAVESARLLAPHDAAWAARAAALRYEPIVTVYAGSAGTRLSEPMLTLAADAARPAQFVFDKGRLGGPDGLLAFVVSGAADWVERGLAATEGAVLAQAEERLGRWIGEPLRPVRTIVEKRATFRCTPGLDRPPLRIGPRLVAAGDYLEGPYPATLEGAVRSGISAARALFA